MLEGLMVIPLDLLSTSDKNTRFSFLSNLTVVFAIGTSKIISFGPLTSLQKAFQKTLKTTLSKTFILSFP